MGDGSTHDHNPDEAHAKVYQIKAIAARVETVEQVAKDHGVFAAGLAELLTDARIDVAKLNTKLDVWGVIVTLGAPMLATFGAWLVVRNTTPPPAPPSIPASVHVAQEPACELPEIQIAAKGKP